MADMREALEWALPLAQAYVEQCRQTRLQAGHCDIGAGTEHYGLWQFEYDAIQRARAALSAPQGGDARDVMARHFDPKSPNKPSNDSYRRADRLIEDLRGLATFKGEPTFVASPPPPAIGEVVRIEHDGFQGTIQGYYTTREGKRGVVLQQIGTRVVHVYGERWLSRSIVNSHRVAADEAKP